MGPGFSYEQKKKKNKVHCAFYQTNTSILLDTL